MNVDFGVIKHFDFREGQSFSFEANFFNLLNHPNFANPDGNIADGTFGVSQSAADPRITQLALRYDF